MKIAVSNQKGGAGKTTTTLNVAGALNELGRDVLVVDADPQGYTTEGVGVPEAHEESDGPTLHDLLTDLDRVDELASIVVEREEMDVVPSHQAMINAERALGTEMKREERLNMLLGHVEDDYDHILIDCPPNLGVLLDNAIVASRNVLIPAQAKKTSKRAVRLLFRQLRGIEPAFGDIREVGLVANEVGVNNDAEEMVAWFREHFEEGQGIPVFEVRKRVELQRATAAGGSIFTHDAGCDMTDVYLDIARHIDEVGA